MRYECVRRDMVFDPRKKKRHGIVALDWIDKKGYVMEFSIVYNQVT